MVYADNSAIWSLKLIDFWTKILLLKRLAFKGDTGLVLFCFLHEPIISSLLPFFRTFCFFLTSLLEYNCFTMVC